MLHGKKNVSGWNDVLEAFQKINGDPLLLESVRDILLLLLIRSINSSDSSLILSCGKSLRKYGAGSGIGYQKPSRNPLLDLEKYRLQRIQRQAAEKAEKNDWPEAIALARALDLLSEKMGTDPDVKDFLYKFKVLLWHKNIQSRIERRRTVFAYGKKSYRIWAVWHKLRNQETYEESNAGPDPRYYSLSVPQDLHSKLKAVSSVTAEECHHSISAGKLNVFVFYAMSSKRTLPKKDFWGIMRYKRIDFLEFLLVDLPGKKLPYSIDEIIEAAIAMIGSNEDFAVQILQLVERTAPGKIASFTDQYGGNWLWYSLFISSRRIRVVQNESVAMSPVQNCLYGLCDPAKPNCDGISFDDLFRNYPIQFLK